MTNNLIIKATNLKRYYQMGDNVVKAIDGIDFEINRGEFVTIVGSSGSGKSTLMHILGLFDTPTSGTFLIDGNDTSKLDDDTLSELRCRHIGFVFQQFNLLNDLNVCENIALPLAYSGHPREKRIHEAQFYAKKLGLAKRMKHIPSELSGGQMQRIAIARAIVNKADIILADEPTGNLDTETGKEILKIFHELHENGHTIILVTHDPNVAKQGTRKITVSDGKIIEDIKQAKKLPSNSSYGKDSFINKNHAGLSFADFLSIGIREGLATHKMRTFLTMLGIIIGVSSVIVMSSFSLGSKKKQANQIRSLGANIITISDNALENEILISSRVKGSKGLSKNDLKILLKNTPEIKEWSISRKIKMNLRYNSFSLTPRIVGIEGNYIQVNNLHMASGRFFDNTDSLQSSLVTILGYKIAEELGGGSILGKNVMMGGLLYTVIGILKDKNINIKELDASSIADPSDSVFIPLQTLLTRTSYLDLRSEIDKITLQLFNEDELYKVGSIIKRTLKMRHRGVEDFKITIPMALLKQKQQSQRLLDILTICISSISIIVGGIGIMNIMLASVTERIREIGIRRATGAKKKDILYQFIMESTLISVTGGILGVFASLIIILITCSLLNIPIVFSSIILTFSLIGSIATGLIFGLYPALQAANKAPVDALRYE